MAPHPCHAQWSGHLSGSVGIIRPLHPQAGRLVGDGVRDRGRALWEHLARAFSGSRLNPTGSLVLRFLFPADPALGQGGQRAAWGRPCMS